MTFYFIGNNLALDFANTLIVDEKDDPFELLRSFDDLIDWASASGMKELKDVVLAMKKLSPEQKADLFKRALHLRAELKKMAQAIAERQSVPASSIESINEVLSQSSGHFELSPTSTGYSVTFRRNASDPSDLLIVIAERAAELLSLGDLSLIRKCQRSACVLYFYDNSKRHGRRWCSMGACGNRAKAAAHYQRSRSQ